jgi:glutamyl-tRNA reductase
VELSQKIFSNLAPATVALVGAGKIGEITLQRLADRGVRHVRVINRSLARAEHLAARYQAQALAFDALHAQLLEADIVITSTSAPEAILSKADVASAMRARHQRPLCIVDLGVPRNVEPSVEALENVYLFNVDDLQGLVDHHHAQRLAAAQEAQAIIDQKVGHFLSWWHEEIVPCGPASSAPAAVR